MEPKQGKWGLWYVDGVSSGFATKEKAEEHVRMKEELAALDAAAQEAEAHASAVRTRMSSQGQLFGTIVGLVALAVLVWVVWNYMLSKPKSPRPERASAAEIAECRERIQREFADTVYSVSLSGVTGTSSDRKGPGGTSRVRVRFDIKAPDGGTVARFGVCQFAPGAPDLLILNQ